METHSLYFSEANIVNIAKPNNANCGIVNPSAQISHPSAGRQRQGRNLLSPSPPRKGHIAQQFLLRTANFSGGKAFRVLIDLKGYGHCIYLLLIESLIMIPHGKRRSTLGFPVKLDFSRA